MFEYPSVYIVMEQRIAIQAMQLNAAYTIYTYYIVALILLEIAIGNHNVCRNKTQSSINRQLSKLC